MNQIKKAAAIFCLSLTALAFSASAKASNAKLDDWDKKTVVTFSQPVEIPGGIVLPAGTYVFKLLNSMACFISSSLISMLVLMALQFLYTKIRKFIHIAVSLVFKTKKPAESRL